MGDWLLRFAAGQGFLPHGYCVQWSAQLLGLMVGSDAVTTASYYSIPITLIALVRARKDIRFNWVFWLFAAFIFLCGTTHLVDIFTVWIPVYWVQGYTKALTATVSAATAVALWILMPRLLKLPSNEQLTRLVAQLEHEVVVRREAQARLDQLNTELELRVHQRTRELEESMLERERLKDVDRARSIAEESSRAKSEFLSNMSHELRTPLNAVIGFSQLLHTDSEVGLSPSQRTWVKHIQAAGEHLLNLIDDVLDMARIEATGVEFQTEAVDLVQVANACEAMLSEAARASNVELDIQVPQPEVPVFSDARRLKQVLMNLLSNAIKYNRPGGRVDAQIVVQDRQLSIRVRDTGIGMTDQQRAQLFSPFNRLGKERDARYQGTGLGLAITKQVVEALGGQISVESVPGKGSVFVAVVPVL